jgi:hypothetical protein
MASRIHAPVAMPRARAMVRASLRTAVGSRVLNPDIAVSGCLPFRAPLTTTFADYPIPRSTDVPSIPVEHLESWRRDHRSASRRSRKGRPRAPRRQ